MPGFRDALIETAVCLNAAQAAFALRQEVEAAGALGDRGAVRRLQPLQPSGQHAQRPVRAARPMRTSTWPTRRPTRGSSTPWRIQMAEILKRHKTSTKPLDSVEKEIVVQFLRPPATLMVMPEEQRPDDADCSSSSS